MLMAKSARECSARERELRTIGESEKGRVQGENGFMFSVSINLSFDPCVSMHAPAPAWGMRYEFLFFFFKRERYARVVEFAVVLFTECVL